MTTSPAEKAETRGGEKPQKQKETEIRTAEKPQEKQPSCGEKLATLCAGRTKTLQQTMRWEKVKRERVEAHIHSDRKRLEQLVRQIATMEAQRDTLVERLESRRDLRTALATDYENHKARVRDFLAATATDMQLVKTRLARFETSRAREAIRRRRPTTAKRVVEVTSTPETTVAVMRPFSARAMKPQKRSPRKRPGRTLVHAAILPNAAPIPTES